MYVLWGKCRCMRAIALYSSFHVVCKLRVVLLFPVVCCWRVLYVVCCWREVIHRFLTYNLSTCIQLTGSDTTHLGIQRFDMHTTYGCDRTLCSYNYILFIQLFIIIQLVLVFPLYAPYITYIARDIWAIQLIFFALYGFHTTHKNDTTGKKKWKTETRCMRLWDIVVIFKYCIIFFTPSSLPEVISIQ